MPADPAMDPERRRHIGRRQRDAVARAQAQARAAIDLIRPAFAQLAVETEKAYRALRAFADIAAADPTMRVVLKRERGRLRYRRAYLRRHLANHRGER